jgi:uncharacterized membrane protein YidH (DUF202 family)
MKLRAILLFLVLVLSLIPVYGINRYLQKVMRPRESAARFFLFLIANFVLIVVYTILLVGLILKVFPPR